MAIKRRILTLESTKSPAEQQKALEEFFKANPDVLKDFEVSTKATKRSSDEYDPDKLVDVRHIVFFEVSSTYTPGEPRRRRRL